MLLYVGSFVCTQDKPYTMSFPYVFLLEGLFYNLLTVQFGSDKYWETHSVY